MVLAGALSDALDGLAARALHASSWVGALLDGIADKAFTLSVLLTVTFDGPLGGAQLAGLLARDVVITLIAAWVGATGRWSLFRRVAARPSGKLTTFALFAMLLALLWRPDLGLSLVWLAIAASVGAAVDYVVVFVRWSVWRVEPAHLPSDSESF